VIRRREDLERICRDVVERARLDEGGDPAGASVVQEMALALDHVQRLRRRSRGFKFALLERECEISTEIMGVRPATWHYMPGDWMERKKMVFKLTTALARVEHQRLRADFDYDKQTMALHDRLLQLLNIHAQLRQYDGIPQDTP